jgi:hypothetical protein
MPAEREGMMKLTIEINDVKNRRACVEAVERLYEALVEHQGGIVGAEHILHEVKYGHGYSAQAAARRKFTNACYQLPNDDLRVVLEYYAMNNPSKRGLAVELAKRNETLPAADHYYRGSREPGTMLQQIKRAFRDHKDNCAIIGAASPALRHEALRRVAEDCARFRDPHFREVYQELTGRTPGRRKG